MSEILGLSTSIEGLPRGVLECVWSFFLTFIPVASSEMEDQFVDLQSIGINDAFNSCHGWLLCAEAPKAGLIAKVKRRDYLHVEREKILDPTGGDSPLVFDNCRNARQLFEDLPSVV